jgi:hypothetical protein
LIWTQSPLFGRHLDMAVTDRRASTSGPSVVSRVVRGKSWVLAMLAPKRGLRVAPVPPQERRICHGPRTTPKRCQVGTKEQAL